MKRMMVFLVIAALICAATGCAAEAPAKTDTMPTAAPIETPAKAPDESRPEEDGLVKLGYIRSFNAAKMIISFNEVEWVNATDTARMGELGLTEKDMPGDYYVYDPGKASEYALTEATRYAVMDWETLETKEVDRAAFAASLDTESMASSCYELELSGNNAVSLREVYTP